MRISLKNSPRFSGFPSFWIQFPEVITVREALQSSFHGFPFLNVHLGELLLLERGEVNVGS